MRNIITMLVVISIMLCSCANANIGEAVKVDDTTLDKIETHSEEKDERKLYLSVIAHFPFTSGDMIEEKETEYVVDIGKAESGEDANLNISQFLPPDSMPDKWPWLSRTKNRTLVSHHDGREMTLKIYDFKLKEYIFSKSFPNKSGYIDTYYFLPELDKYIIEENEAYYLVEVITGIRKRIENIDKMEFGRIVFSPDETKCAYIMNKKGINYITIYSFDSMKQICSIPMEKEKIYLSDWGMDNRMYYNCGLNGYSIGVDGSNKVDLGKFIFHPTLSPDGKYLAYSRPDEFEEFYDLGEIEEYSALERGVYLLDMATKESIYLTPYIEGASTIPTKFFYREELAEK
ncbi:TolB family protein [Lutispora sp.]|uniref:TolB family protein n=1 Tax=Lutispora sp. TaxID=2828727 RepID=UPI002B21D533|nr:hypothetical protein [Lutispora sp.]MEA4962442.1 hypothetical protein [Lutispora sp.]